jgi:HK97 gp10 family phage protein
MGVITAQALAIIFARAATEIKHAHHDILENASELFEKSAKDAIGNDAYIFGWPPLAGSTIARKGFDRPLYETGELQNSIQHNVDDHEAYVGTDVEYAKYQEYGTSRIPARPFLGGAIIHEEKHIPEVVHKALAKLFP